MDPVEGAKSFQATGDAYDRFMGRYSRSLAHEFAPWAGIDGLQSVLDVGCGPGALTAVLVDSLGASAVSAFDPSPSFVEECARRFPGVAVQQGRAEAIPYDDDSFDGAFAQLVLHFVSDPETAANELQRVVRAGGIVAACVWDFDEGMQMLRRFWDAALAVDTNAPDEAQTLRFGRRGEIADLLRHAGFSDVEETTLSVSATYSSFDELWSSFQGGIGPAGAYCRDLDDDTRAAIEGELFTRIGSPTAGFSLTAVARAAKGLVPG